MDTKHPKEISNDEILEFARNHVGFLDLDLKRMSKLFLRQIFTAHEYRQYSIFSVLNEVKYLEGITKKTNTKKATEFSKPPLRGLWHKHFLDAHFITKNIKNHWNANRGKKLEAMITEVFKSADSDVVTDAIINQIAHKTIVEAFQDRIGSKQCTGEWIIYAIKGNKNYYLTIASHEESDKEVYKRIETCCAGEFHGILPVNNYKRQI